MASHRSAPGPKQAGRLKLLQDALRAHQQGRGVEAERLYRRLLAEDPRSFEARHLLGLLLFQTGAFAEAASHLTAALSIQPKNPAVLTTLGLVAEQVGAPEEALARFEAVLAAKPDDPAALNHRGNALRRLGRAAEAVASYEAAIARKPDYGEAFANRAAALRDLGRPAEALFSAERALGVKPGLIEAFRIGAAALLDMKRPTEALAACEKALALTPHDPATWSDRGNVLLALGRPAEALESYDRALALKPDFPLAAMNRAIALRELKRLDAALAACNAALARAPDHAETHNVRGTILRELHLYDAALESYDRALALAPDHAEALNNRGIILRELGRHAEALEAYDAAIALRPGMAMIFSNKGNLLSELGRLDEAGEALAQAIAREPKNPRFYYNLTEIRRMRREDPAVSGLLALATELEADGDAPVAAQIDLHFALGKVFTDLGEPARAFDHLRRANALKHAQIPYDERAVLDQFERMRAAFPATSFTDMPVGRHDAPVPIFIVGMPRCGSTLVEQVLASHPAVTGLGEIEDFARALEDMEEEAPLAGLEDLALWPEAHWQRLGARYRARIEARAPPGVGGIVNKRLDNFIVAGLIAKSLPNARIIHVERDAVDTCLSCFSKHFMDNLPYTYDLGTLGRYYRGYEAMMAHWSAALPEESLMSMRYEDVVEDLEGAARRLLAFCGLDWDPRVLAFHETERHVRTASLTQVRQPIFKSSVGRWRTHAAQLGPLLEALGR